MSPDVSENHFDSFVRAERIPWDILAHTDTHSDSHSDQHSDRHGDHSDEGPPHEDHYDDGEGLFSRFDRFVTVIEEALIAHGQELVQRIDDRTQIVDEEATRLFNAQAERIAALEQRIAELEQR